MLTATYIPGLGYTIRNARGQVLAHGCTPAQRDVWISHASVGAMSQQLLDALRNAPSNGELILPITASK